MMVTRSTIDLVLTHGTVVKVRAFLRPWIFAQSPRNLALGNLAQGILGLGMFAMLCFSFVTRPSLHAGEPSGIVAIQEAVQAEPDHFSTEIVPILDKYCFGCHNQDEREAGVSFETFAQLLEGGDSGPVLLAGDPDNSHFIRLIRGDTEPRMPPDDMEGPTPAELDVLVAWVAAGAEGPAGEMPDRSRLIVPQLETPEFSQHINASDWDHQTGHYAIAMGNQVTVMRSRTETAFTKEVFSGRINSLSFSQDGRWVVAAGGITGLIGYATILDAQSGATIASFEGHRDSLYAAAIDPSGVRVATAGYDKTIHLWDIESQSHEAEITGHNQPIFALEFDATGTVLLSASADETLKLWRVADGSRLDTLGQPQGEQYVARFTPDGTSIVGAGADNRIRVWEFESRETAKINPLKLSRFAHEGAITHLDFSQDGRRMVTVSEDRSIKVWDTQSWREIQLIPNQQDMVTCLSVSADGETIFVGRINGTAEHYQVESGTLASLEVAEPMATTTRTVGETFTHAEAEPNGSAVEATTVELPVTISGTIAAEQGQPSDRDYFRFEAKAGEQWIVEVNAARQGSPLDSKIEIVDSEGQPVLRERLQAVRDSYFTFRGKDSNTSDDFRVHNWEEMELNEYLYANGEVVRLWLYPRGPDSGFQVYPGFGARHTFFDTSPLAHALQEPCFIVKPVPLHTEIIPSGLPVFPIYFENDDDSRRKLGSDSKLLFTAPSDGVYCVGISDARGFGGEDFTYDLQIRPPAPDFAVRLQQANPKVAPGGAREFMVSAERFDYFDDEIVVEITDVPDGFHVTSPIVIEAGQLRATGVIWAVEDASAPTADQSTQSIVTARAMINGEPVEHDVNSLGTIELASEQVVRIRMRTAAAESTEPTSLDEPQPVSVESSLPDQELRVLEIRPGETVVARVHVERNGLNSRIDFGKADSGRNLPHGVYIDNIGLNGLMIVEGQSERSFFVTAADWVEPQERLFHLKANVQGGQSSLPVLLRVLPRE